MIFYTCLRRKTWGAGLPRCPTIERPEEGATSAFLVDDLVVCFDHVVVGGGLSLSLIPTFRFLTTRLRLLTFFIGRRLGLRCL